MSIVIVWLLIALLVWVLFEIIFFFSHRHPLSTNEIERLSVKRRRLYIKKAYSFLGGIVEVNPAFKSSLNPKGELYNINISLRFLPVYAADVQALQAELTPLWADMREVMKKLAAL